MPWRPVENEENDSAAARALRKKSRLLVDEHVHPDAVEYLRSNGVNVKTAVEMGLRGRGDCDLLAAAKEEGRILLTCDKGFWDETRHPVRKASGIIIMDRGSYTDLVTQVVLVEHYLLPFARLVGEMKFWVHASGAIDSRLIDHTGAVKTFRHRVGREVEEWVGDDGVR